MRISLKSAILAACVVVAAATSAASDGVERNIEPMQGVSISQICVETASKGEQANVSLVIENWSGQTVTLQGISSRKSDRGELYFRGAFNTAFPSEGLTILRNETLNLASSHIGARLSGLSQDIQTGDHVPLRLEFRGGVIEVGAHAKESGAC